MAQAEEKPDCRGKQKRGRIETWSGAGDWNGGDSLSENGGESVAETIENHDDGENVGHRAKPLRVSEGQRREKKQDEVCHDQADEPFAKLVCGHGKPRVFGSNRAHSRVVEGEKSGECFVGNVRAKREAQRKPGVSEIGSALNLGRHVAADSTANSAQE